MSRYLDADDTASQRSGASGASGTSGAASGLGQSETSSQRSDSKFLRRERNTSGAEREEGDLLEQKRSIQDGIFSCMYTLVRQAALSGWKFAVLKVLLEGLMGFIVVFNPSITAWKIDVSNPVWQVVRWTVWRSPIVRLYGYKTYIIVLYVMVAAVFLAVLGLVGLTLAMRRQEQSKWLRAASIALHIVYDVMFIMLYVSFFDYFVFSANCNFANKEKSHVYFGAGVNCMAMPHIAHMAVALVTAVLFFCVTALMVVASSDLNPISRAYLASPVAVARLQILVAKAAYVIVANDLQSWPKPQAVGLVLCAALICWWNFRRLPFYRTSINIVWCSFWFGILYVSGLLAYLAFGKDHSLQHRHNVTMLVLYGIFPTIAAGCVVCAVHAWWAAWPARKFRGLAVGVRVAKIHKFRRVEDVELLSRAVRKFTTDGAVDEDAAALGETIIKAGMQVFPNTPFLLILYANFLLEVRKDGPASRTQLQQASRHSPTLIERYQIFCTGESSKRLKDSQECGMDLQAYIEFRRNIRAVLRVHKEVLMLQAELWMLMLKTCLRVAEVDKALDALEAGTLRAHQVYRRVLERYPTNGKLLRCYGKFLEDVKHDPIAAAKAYSEASRNGGGDAILNLDLSGIQGSASKPEFLTSMSMEDDAVVVINAEGTIMMVSQAVQKVFGYPKAELEGANVSLLMPQPFCQRHTGYLQRYAGGGEPHILDTVREVVALHKDRYVFPMALCVTRMSGMGSDSIFLGVARPLASNALTVRAWLAPNGVVLCGDQQFASLCGVQEADLIGKPLSSLVCNELGEVERLLERCREASLEELMARSISIRLLIKHRYLDPVPVDVTVALAGTDAQRILVLACNRTDGREGSLLVVDSHMRLCFASVGVSTLLGYPMRKLATMRLEQLLPPPYNTLHSKYLRDPPSAIPPTSCRSGKVVHLINENGSPVAVRLKISVAAATDTAMTLYVVQIEKRPMDDYISEKQLVVTSDFGGRVLSVSDPESELFGFRSANMVGCNLCDVVDIFREWRDRAGEYQMQLLMLALLDKEHEMPGTSWRVRVQAPVTEPLPHHLSRSPSRCQPPSAMKTAATTTPNPAVAYRSACLQVELHDDMFVEEEDGDGQKTSAGGDNGSSFGGARGSVAVSSGAYGTRIRVTLWRRDLLTGVVELDEDLVIRRASPITGLIVGMPSTSMLKKPLQRFLDVPADTSWEKLAEAHSRHKKQRSALKSSSNRGVISPIMAFIGPHPDTGTMRIIVQGVQVLAPGGRSKVVVTLHPDTTYAGAHADLMRVLHLDAALLVAKSARRQTSQAGKAGVGGAGGRGEGATAGGSAPIRQQHSSCRPGAVADWLTPGTAVAAPAAAKADPENAPENADEDLTGKEGRNGDGDGGEDGEEEAVGSEGDGEDDGEDEGEDEGEGNGTDSSGSGGRRRQRRLSDGGRDLEAEDQARLLSRAASKSEFVAQWVRTISKRPSRRNELLTTSRPTTAVAAADAPDPDAPDAVVAAAAAAAAAAAGAAATSSGAAGVISARGAPSGAPTIEASGLIGSERKPGALATIPEYKAATGAELVLLNTALSRRRTGQSFARVLSGRDGSMPLMGVHQHYAGGGQVLMGSRQSSGELMTGADGNAAGGSVDAGGGGGNGGETGGGGGGGDADVGGGGEKWDKGSEAGESSAEGSQSASGITSSTDMQSGSELIIDTRRCRLLKALTKQLAGPVLMRPMERLRLHSYVLLVVMVTTHVVAYIVISVLISEQYHEIKLVHRQALAMDRSQLIAVRAMMGAFCERANVTAKVSVCANSLNFTMNKLRENVNLMESHHQYVFLGDSRTTVMKLMPEVYDIWTSQQLEYHSYLDTYQPRVLSAFGGAWVLGNRYIAAAREALYWLPNIREKYRLHRTYQFLVDNGLGPLFTVYARSLDLLVDSAWKAVDQLRIALITLLVVEPLFVQCCCLAYEWVLVQRLERARLVGILAMVGLPAPVLRQLATKEVKVLDDSDDDDDDGDSDNDEGGERDGAASGNEKMLVTAATPTAAEQDDMRARGGGEAPALPRPLRFRSIRKPEPFTPPDASSPVRARRRVRTPPDAADGAANDLVNGEPPRPDDGFPKLSPPGVRRTSPSADGKTPAPATAIVTAATAAGPAAFSGSAPSEGGVVGMPLRRGSRDGGSNHRLNGRESRARGLHINGKQLVPSASTVTKFMVPFVLWNAALVIVYVVSLLQLNAMQGPLASLNMASHIIYRYTRVRAIAFGLVSQDDATARSLWREMLRTELRYFESEYDALMYGGIPITQMDSVFKHSVPASTFASTSFASEFFRSKRCFQYDQGGCLRPDDEYYEVTHNGLDVMVRRMLAEMNLLVADADEDIVTHGYNGTRYIYMYKVGANDLYEGLQQAAQLFVDFSISRYGQVGTLHTILLAVTIALVLLYLLFILWPHLARLQKDATRQSALLSHVPPEVDVRSHVRAVFKRSSGWQKGGRALAGRGRGGSAVITTAAAGGAATSIGSDGDSLAAGA
ncbi:hypothetical protein VaNZ11_004468 [Volvox africanus]|uniref:PAS domain-containing protein n=1 Tax=Volvox africanus TaxID=51714 RepID=A0ABQ5RWC8_9CHLO|nr:hypothetical protein VaNZ11_004468 [Volvox africanus]